MPGGVGDDLAQLGVEERLAAQQADVERAECVHGVDAPLQNRGRNRRRNGIVLGAVAAAQVTAARHDKLAFERALRDEGLQNPHRERDGRQDGLPSPFHGSKLTRAAVTAICLLGDSCVTSVRPGGDGGKV